MKVLHYDAFATEPNMGNPAGVVLNGDSLTNTQMQKIAKSVGFNETAFICSSELADIKLKYFTPGHEMNLCGHGTMASIVAGYENNIFKDVKTIETKAGILNISLDTSDSCIKVKMEHTPAKFIEFTGDKEMLASSLSLKVEDIDTSYPIMFGNTGIWTLLLPIKKLDTFKRMKPNNAQFPTILKQIENASIHPFCLETYNNVDMHGRHFSSPYSGTIEDIATGTASGVMGAYYVKFINQSNRSLKIEQGQEIGKNGIIGVNVEYTGENYNVEIEGTAVFVKEIM